MGGEYNGVGLVEMTETFVTQDDCFLCNGTNGQRDYVGFIPDNTDKLN